MLTFAQLFRRKAVACFLSGGTGRGAPVPRSDGFDDVARGGMAVYPTRAFEALVAGLGWVAFDPTNNLVGADRHIRVAIGRDYADVPPTRGVYKGEAQSELSVAVMVSPAESSMPEAQPRFVVRSRPVLVRAAARSEQEQQQQQ